MSRRILLIDIGSGLTLSGVLPSVALYADYSARLLAGGGTAPYTYTLASGALPAGLYLDAATGVISGTATAAGRFPITVRVMDISGTAVVRAFAVQVVAEPLALSGAAPDGTVGVAQSYTYTVAGGVPPYTFELIGAPAGWSVPDSSMPTIDYTPATDGVQSWTLRVTDSDGTAVDLVDSADVTDVVVDPVGQAIGAKLVSWWDFDGNTYDSLRSSNDLAYTADPTYSAGLIGQKVHKGSALQSVPPSLGTGTVGFTFGGWYQSVATTDDDIIDLAESSSTSYSPFYLAVRSSGTKIYLVGTNTSNSATNCPSAGYSTTYGGWHFVVGRYTYSSKLMELFVDGVAAGTATLSGTAKPIGRIAFGRLTSNTYNALDNDSSFYADQLLTDAEISWLYNSGAGRAFADLTYANPVTNAARKSAWTWFNDPRVLYSGGKFAVGFTGAETGAPISVVTSTDGGVTFGSRYDFASSGATVDDHDNPAFIRRADGKLLAFLIRHNDSTYQVAVSNAVDDPTSWAANIDISSQLAGGNNWAYATPVMLEGESGSPIYNFFRDGGVGGARFWTKTLDGGTTWTAQEQIIGTGGKRPYLKIAKNGTNRIDVLCTDGGPNAGEETTNSVYHAYYQGGSWYKSDGTLITASKPFLPSTDFTRIYDGSGAGGRGWIWDIQIDGSGSPVVLYSHYPSTTDHRYSYAKLVSGAWVTSEICSAGTYLYSTEPYYSGGMCFNPQDLSQVIASRQVGSANHNLYNYRTTDGGATWTGSQLTSYGKKTFRPYIPQGSARLFFVSGDYSTYSNFSTSILSMPVP